MQKDFYINDQFLVKPGANLLVDGLISKISKVDPKVMRLLCMLAEHNGRLVLKEELMTTIWRDNGGSEEELDHAVATLRKLLQDDKKSIIRQVARKGYSINGSFTNADIDDLTKEATTSAAARMPATAAQKWIMSLSIMIILLLIAFALFNYTWSGETPTQPGNCSFPQYQSSVHPQIFRLQPGVVFPSHNADFVITIIENPFHTGTAPLNAPILQTCP